MSKSEFIVLADIIRSPEAIVAIGKGEESGGQALGASPSPTTEFFQV